MNLSGLRRSWVVLPLFVCSCARVDLLSFPPTASPSLLSSDSETVLYVDDPNVKGVRRYDREAVKQLFMSSAAQQTRGTSPAFLIWRRMPPMAATTL